MLPKKGQYPGRRTRITVW